MGLGTRQLCEFLYSGLHVKTSNMADGATMEVDKNLKVGFIGGGNMARAIAEGFISSGVVSAGNITASATTDKTLAIWKSLGCQTTLNNLEVVSKSSVVFLAVKPYIIPCVLQEVGPSLTSEHLVVSVAAGIRTKLMEENLPSGSKCRIIRSLPNLACSVKCGVTSYCCGSLPTRQDAAFFEQLMKPVALTLEIKESLMNTAAAFGCGTAFMSMAIEALSDGGVKVGMPRGLSSQIATQTVLGAAALIKETGKHPAQVKDEVASPAGATIAGIQVLERSGFRAALIDAIDVAKKRAVEMGELS